MSRPRQAVVEQLITRMLTATMEGNLQFSGTELVCALQTANLRAVQELLKHEKDLGTLQACRATIRAGLHVILLALADPTVKH